MTRLKTPLLGILLTSLIATAVPASQQETDWDDLGPNVMIEDQVRPIIEAFDRYHRSQNALICKGEIRALLKQLEIDEVMFLSARAQRPNFVEVAIVAKNSMFPTDIFISNGTELFEQSIRLLNYMISPVAEDFQSLHDRVIARSAPNVPVEIITSLMSDSPMKNLLQITSEPGLVRLIGTADVNGVLCNEISVNEHGTRVWISKELPPRLMRYRSSPALMKPRYLPEGAIVTGPSITVDFKSWGITGELDTPWEWSAPVNSNRMATMHENAAGPGPEAGFDEMLWEEGREMKTTGGPALSRSDDSNEDVAKAISPLIAGDTAPNIGLVDVQGVETDLNSIRNDRPALVIFWVPGGKFSRSSMPGIIRAAQGITEDVSIIPVGSPMSPGLVSENRTMPEELVGWCDVEGLAARRFGVSGTPAVFLIDADGMVIETHIGPKPRFATRIPKLVKSLEESAASESEKTDSTDTDDATGDPGAPSNEPPSPSM